MKNNSWLILSALSIALLTAQAHSMLSLLPISLSGMKLSPPPSMPIRPPSGPVSIPSLPDKPERPKIQPGIQLPSPVFPFPSVPVTLAHPSVGPSRGTLAILEKIGNKRGATSAVYKALFDHAGSLEEGGTDMVAPEEPVDVTLPESDLEKEIGIE